MSFAGERGRPQHRMPDMPTKRQIRRRRSVATLSVGLATAAVAAVAIVLLVGNGGARAAAERFVEAWSRGDWAAMYAELTPESQATHPPERMRRAYADSARTGTLIGLELGTPGDARSEDGQTLVPVPVRVRTRAFGSVRSVLELPATGAGVAWEPHLAFPGLRPGERLVARTRLPPRRSILAGDGTPIAEGPAEARSSPLGIAAGAIAGAVEEPADEDRAALAALGYPPGAPVGTTGLEAAFQRTLAGNPGGRLVATGRGAARVLMEAEPRPGSDVRTTIETVIQEAAVTALGERLGGVAVLDVGSGAVLGLAGIAFSAPQPPGSTFKILTAAAALEEGIATASTSYPVETTVAIDGRDIRNADHQACGGTFVESFAASCNTVFAPLGAELGGDRVRETASRFGFNRRPALFDELGTRTLAVPESTFPDDIASDLEAGTSAIGQGRVLATPLQMASVAQTIAADGVLRPTPIAEAEDLRPAAGPRRATSAEVARTLRRMMVAVVEEGTGGAAAPAGTSVAGKTGTAELGTLADPEQEALSPGAEPERELNAWFAGFAPADRPRFAAAVMLVEAGGGGGDLAAPVFREIIAAALDGSGEGP